MPDKLKRRDTKIRSRSPCPYCDKILDGAASYEGHRPTPGCFSICIYCASILKFGKRLKLMKATNEELKKLDTEDPIFMNKLRYMQRIVRDLDRRPPWEKSEKPNV